MTLPIPTNPSPTGYISFPIDVDPSSLLATAIANIQAQIPGWTPMEGQLDVIVLEEVAQMLSVIASIATQVPMSIFMSFGQLVGVLPNFGLAATVDAIFTMFDLAGYTIPAGTQIAFPLSGNASILFTVNTPLIIPPGSGTGTTQLICTEVGSFPNGLAAGTTLRLQQTFAAIESIVTTDVVSGGVDPDTVTSYINRLSQELTLLAPRPILPIDFAEISQNVDGVFRACAINGLSPGRTVTDGVTSSGSPTIGSATADFTDDDIGRSVTGNVTAGSFIIAIVNSTTATLNAGHSGLSNLTGITMTFGDLTAQERCIAVCGLNADGTQLSPTIDADLLAYLQAKREVNFVVNIIQPTYSAIDVSVTAQSSPGADIGATQAAVVAAIGTFLSPATWGGGAFVPPVWNPTPTVSLLALADAILSVTGVAFIQLGDLDLAIHGNSLTSADVALPGDAPLPQVGTVTVAIT